MLVTRPLLGARAGLCLKRNSLSVRAGGYAYGLFLQAGQYELWRGAGWVLGVLRDTSAVFQRRQAAFDHRRIFEAGNQPHGPATGLAGLDIHFENALQSLHPSHRRVAIGRGLLRAPQDAVRAARALPPHADDDSVRQFISNTPW